MAIPCCPTCGRAAPKPKAVKLAFTPLSEAERANMTLAQVHAYYKRTSHIEDVRFAIKYGITAAMPAELREAWDVLLFEAEHGLSRTETHRRLWRLCTRWGVIQNEQDPALAALYKRSA